MAKDMCSVAVLMCLVDLSITSQTPGAHIAPNIGSIRRLLAQTALLAMTCRASIRIVALVCHTVITVDLLILPPLTQAHNVAFQARCLQDLQKEKRNCYVSLILAKHSSCLAMPQVHDHRGKKVGLCKEWAKVVGTDKVDDRILAMRHETLPFQPPAAKTSQPERVLTYK